MYLRHMIRKKDGKVHHYWCLVRSVRVGRRVIQQTVAYLGELDEQGRVHARALARNLIGMPEAPISDVMVAYWRARTSRLNCAAAGIRSSSAFAMISNSSAVPLRPLAG